MKSKILFILITFFYFNSSFADVLKPSVNIDPKQVVLIQLKALMKNDSPYKDRGIEQTWEFAHPNNQKYTGPLEKFKIMLKGESYKMLLNHLDHKIVAVQVGNGFADYEVTVLDVEKKYYKFNWRVEKYQLDGNLKNCWLTTMVSQPIPLGSSI